jgi:hypothetical protein
MPTKALDDPGALMRLHNDVGTHVCTSLSPHGAVPQMDPYRALLNRPRKQI